MVIAIEKAAETVAIVTRPSYQEKSVYSNLEYSDHRRHKEQVNFRPVLHPIRYSDTAFVYLNNTRKRFLSRTFYEPRVRPQSFSDTTFNRPKTVEHHYVSYLDHHVDKNRKWFKTCIEIKAKNFTSAQILRSQNNNYINTSANTTLSTSISGPLSPGGLLAENGADLHAGSVQNGGSFKEKYDPGASQVFIPQRRDYPFGNKSLVNGEVTFNFPNSKVDLNYTGITDNFSDV
ncbi:unnamed protein product [Candidula unifasciata]|uniref:Uncharacterized protein n=1 Tax=Candidula unifasciata TaxID=100452 RepID=A0A8S3ZQT0_9EUPU|nr:unnamed protein product [Candidula unifasciata]